jgi:hypothetical protein
MKCASIIAAAVIAEQLRSRGTLLIALLLVLLTPGLAWLAGDDADTRAWLSRLIPAEVLRIFLPLSVIAGGAFLLRPALRRGWALLPARRSEWFMGNAMAGGVLLLAATLLFGVGAAAAGMMFGKPLARTVQPATLHSERVHQGQAQRLEIGDGLALINPAHQEWLIVALPEGLNDIHGTLEFVGVLTGERAPAQRSPVALELISAESSVPLDVQVESRSRVRFSGGAPGASHLLIHTTDDALAILTSASRIRFTVGESAPTASLPALLAVAFGASLLCLCVVLAIRSLSTAPTAALAGALLLAALTLLPALAPAESMARDHRRDLEGVEVQRGWLEKLEEEFAALPQLFPDRYFDEYLTGYVVPSGAFADGLLRFSAGVLLLIPGALLFRRRQM